MSRKLEASDAELARAVRADLAARRTANRGTLLERAWKWWVALGAVNVVVGAIVPLTDWLSMIGCLLLLTGASVALALHRAVIRERIAEFEAGQRCLRCESRTAVRSDTHVTCSACGYTTTVERVQFTPETERAAEPLAARPRYHDTDP